LLAASRSNSFCSVPCIFIASVYEKTCNVRYRVTFLCRYGLQTILPTRANLRSRLS
jgi:hypothetical protein